MEDKELERWLIQMENTASALEISSETHVKQIREIMADDNLELPENCPSKASLAELTPLRRIEKNLEDANYTFQKLREYVWEHYGKK